MKNTQLIKSVAIFSLLTFLMMLTLGHFAFSAETAAPTAPSAESLKTGAFYDCLHSAKDNYFWNMTVTKSLPQSINGSMKIEEIMNHVGPEEIVAQLAMESAQKTLMRFVNKAISGTSKEDFNLTKEFSHNLRLYGRYLRLRIKQEMNREGSPLYKYSFKNPISYEVLFAPSPTAAALDRLNPNDIKQRTYPSDRVVLAEKLIGNDSSAFDVERGDRAKKAMESLMRTALNCGTTAGIHQAYPLSILLSMTINPDIDSSEMRAQFVVGMPMGKSGEGIPFTQSNEQITFQTITLPKIVGPEDMGNKGDYEAYMFPVAFVDITGNLDSTEIEMQVRFGTIGELTPSGWQRAAYGDKDNMKLLPKLRGVPGDKNKDAVAEKAKQKLSVDFNIYNLVLKIDYTKYGEKAAVEVSDLQLLISAGLNRFPDFKVGRFNVTSVNDQFKSEINKAIVAEIDKQDAAVKQKLADAKAEVSKNTGLTPKQIDGILSTLFSKDRTAASAAGSN